MLHKHEEENSLVRAEQKRKVTNICSIFNIFNIFNMCNIFTIIIFHLSALIGQVQPQQQFPYLNLNLSSITKRNGLGHGSILKYSNAKCLFKVMALQNTANKLKISVTELKIMCFVLAVVNKNKSEKGTKDDDER